MSKNYKKILIAIDGSEQAEAALKEAITLCKRDNAQLFVLHDCNATRCMFNYINCSRTK